MATLSPPSHVTTDVTAVPVFAPQRSAPSYQIPSILTARLPAASQSTPTVPNGDPDLFEQALQSSQRRPPMVKDALTEEAKLRCRVQIETRKVDIRRYEVDVQKTGYIHSCPTDSVLSLTGSQVARGRKKNMQSTSRIRPKSPNRFIHFVFCYCVVVRTRCVFAIGCNRPKKCLTWIFRV